MTTHRPTEPWPELDYEQLTPMIGHLQRLVQVAGKYTLDNSFEPAWGNIVFEVTPRGLRSPLLRRDGVSFEVHYRLLDNDVVIEAATGSRTLPLQDQTVAAFYGSFVAAAAELGLPGPGSSAAVEIPGAVALDVDAEPRAWNPEQAAVMWAALDSVAHALRDWQSSYRGHRPGVGVMWGGFDLSATRFRGVSMDPPSDRPVFMQAGMTEEVVALGFSFGSEDAPHPGMYAYIAPEPEGLEQRSWSPDGAMWIPPAGVAILAWDALRSAADPAAAIIEFADDVYAAAVELGGWPAELATPRQDGWHASRVPPAPH